MNTKTLKISLVVAGAMALLSGRAFAQHYPAGAEGIKAASLPPAGVYLRDYNFAYAADTFAGGPPGFEVFAYVNAPRLIWMTDWTVLGAAYGMDVIVPFGYTRMEAGGNSEDAFGLRDIQVEPLLLSWHTKRFDFAAGYALWAPSGDFGATEMVNLGSGYWSHMLTAGATWNLDEKKTWALSLLNRYEINYEQEDTGVTYGNMFTMEAAFSKSLGKGLDLGVVGYWQQQTTENSGPAPKSLSHVVAIGPEISGVIPKINVITSLRYLREFESQGRPEGQELVLTFTKRF